MIHEIKKQSRTVQSVNIFIVIKPSEITKYRCYIDEVTGGEWVNNTTICLFCGIDSIIPNGLVN